VNWTRFDSNARAHAKLAKVGNDAASWWAFAVMWSNQNGTDGYLDGKELGKVLPCHIANDLATTYAEACVAAIIKPGGKGLLERADGGYQIHDFEQFQPPADEEEKRAWLSEKRRQAGKLGALARWQNDSKPGGKPTRARASDRSGSDRKEGGAGGEKNLTNGAHSGELAARVWDELWSAKYGRAYAHSKGEGPKSERASLERLELLSIERAAGAPHPPEAFLRHWVRRCLKDTDPWLVENSHPIRGLEPRINKYGDPKKPRPPALSEPPPAPRIVRALPAFLNGKPAVRKASTHDELDAKAKADKARLLAVERNGAR